jgi:LPXTG-site transpeptidase (sortase) family protein
MLVVGVILAAIAAALYVYDRQAEPKPPPDALTSRSAPSSAEPSPQAIANYTVPSLHPKYIAIPSIDVGNSRVRELGLTSGGAIATPDNIYDAGWYDRSSLPGQKGAEFIYGHVSSWTAHGIFYDLKKLKAGDNVVVTRGDNKKFTYRVVSTKIYPYKKVDMNQVLRPVSAGEPGLNIMTCTGRIIKGTSEFSERLVVFTKLVNS